MRRVLHITNIPTPYRIPQLNEMNRQFVAAGWQLMVAFGAQGYSRRKWKVDLSECQFDYRVLRSTVRGRRSGSTVFLYGGLYQVLQSFAPDVIIVTGFSLATLKLWLWSLVKGTPYLIFSGSIQHSGRSEKKWRRWQRKILSARAAGGVAYGSKAKEYLVGLGMRQEQISIGVNTVDIGFFRKQTESVKQQRTAATPRQHLLYVGRLAKKKRVDLLLQAVARLQGIRQDFLLRIVGDGPEEEALKDLAHCLRVEAIVRFEGFKQKEELPVYLAAADCFLFPSEYDIWGLVLNEAMAAGLPCLASIHAGATTDLIEDGVTGFAVDFADVDGVVERINWVLNHPGAAAAMGRRASRYISEHANLECSAAGFVEAVQQAWWGSGRRDLHAL